MGILLKHLPWIPDFHLTQVLFCTFVDLLRRVLMCQSQNFTHLLADPFDRIERGQGVLRDQADVGATPMS